MTREKISTKFENEIKELYKLSLNYTTEGQEIIMSLIMEIKKTKELLQEETLNNKQIKSQIEVSKKLLKRIKKLKETIKLEIFKFKSQ